MQADTIGTFLTLCVCGALGWFLARTFPMPIRVRTWVLLSLAIVGGAFVGIHTALLSVFGVGLRVNVAISSCAAGTLIALAIRTGRQRRHSAGAA